MSTELASKEESRLENVRERPAIRPPVDIYENKDEYLVVADMPGVHKDSLEINLDAERLYLRGTVASEELGTAIEREYQMIDYERTFQLPDIIARDKVSAELKEGVLTLRLPKVEAVKPRQIKVKAG